MTRRGTPEADLQRMVVQALRAVLPRTAITRSISSAMALFTTCVTLHPQRTETSRIE